MASGLRRSGFTRARSTWSPPATRGTGRRRMIAYGHVDFTCSEDIWNWDSWSNPVYFDQVGFDQVEFDQDVRITIAILPGED